VDEYGDSYTRDVTVDDLKQIFDAMIRPNSTFSPNAFLSELEEHGKGLGETPGSMFSGCVTYFATADTNFLSNDQVETELPIARYRFLFAGGAISEDDEDEAITHVVVVNEVPEIVKGIRQKISQSGRVKLPRVVGLNWLHDSWRERTLLDEDRYAIII
jgi:DNA ligase 4